MSPRSLPTKIWAVSSGERVPSMNVWAAACAARVGADCSTRESWFELHKPPMNPSDVALPCRLPPVNSCTVSRGMNASALFQV